MIKRYEFDCYAGTVWIEEKVLGDYIKYKDHCEAMEAQRANHLAIVEKLKAEIALLKMQQGVMYQNGWVDGYANGSNYD